MALLTDLTTDGLKSVADFGAARVSLSREVQLKTPMTTVCAIAQCTTQKRIKLVLNLAYISSAFHALSASERDALSRRSVSIGDNARCSIRNG